MSEAMNPRIIDMTGVRIHTLKVIRKARKDEKPPLPSAPTAAFWICRCGKCGKTVVKNGSLIRKGTARCDCDMYTGRGKPAKASVKLATNLNDIFGRERSCPVCGKPFLLLSAKWVYRVNEKFVCSWGCQRQAERRDCHV